MTDTTDRRDLHPLPRLAAGVTVIDSHCHLDMDRLAADQEAVIERARAAGVTPMITIGAGGPFECNHAALALAQRHADIFATVGVHPHEASTVTDDVLSTIERLADDPRVVAIGETGLDFYYDNSPRPAQEAAFRRFIQLARARRLPVVIHLRDAYDRAAAILREEHGGEVGGVIHCFSGDRAAARTFLDLGFHLSFSGIVTFKNADELRRAAVLTPTDRLLVETDAPFLTPVPLRGKRNEPAYVLYTAAHLAEVRHVDLNQLAATTAANTRHLFPALRAEC
jgi:TatD DNase family protein